MQPIILLFVGGGWAELLYGHLEKIDANNKKLLPQNGLPKRNIYAESELPTAVVFHW